ncbi:MAG: hypothetical protein EPN85_09900 [Bacteroidetes bacterium]|nr:MAG: hypothetical protein EPN85_09900 [Bacteroidota bacterium]
MKRPAIILFFIFIFSFLMVNAQDKKTKKTVRAEALLHRPISNKAFSQLFSGVFSANISMNFGVSNFNTGIFYNMMQSQIFPKFLSDPHSIQTVHTAGVRFSYDVYPSKTKMVSQKGNFFVFSPYLSGGFAEVDYSRLKCIAQQATGKHSQTFSAGAGANFNLMFSEYDGVGFTLGYTFINHAFNPDPLCLNEFFPNIPDKDKHGLSQYILYGFNVHFDLTKRDQDSD